MHDLAALLELLLKLQVTDGRSLRYPAREALRDEACRQCAAAAAVVAAGPSRLRSEEALSVLSSRMESATFCHRTSVR